MKKIEVQAKKKKMFFLYKKYVCLYLVNLIKRSSELIVGVFSKENVIKNWEPLPPLTALLSANLVFVTEIMQKAEIV